MSDDDHDYDGDSTVQGQHRPTFHAELSTVLALLTATRGALRGKTMVMRDFKVVLGREGQAGFVVPDDSASRRHASITRDGEEFILEDLGSRNGTYVDGVPVLSCVLRRGDRIDIGATTLVFDWVYERKGNTEVF